MTACEFGNIERAEMAGNELRLTGHNYVAIAFDRDDPYMVTRFVGVHGNNLPQSKIDLLGSASDVYDCEVSEHDGALRVHFWLDGGVEAVFHCTEIIKEYRYYTREEIEEILQWLPSRCSDRLLRNYLEALSARGFRAAVRDGKAVLEGGG